MRWDYDGINENVLVDLNFSGQMRKVLVNFDRNGFSYTLDRATGELLMAEPFVNVNWATGVDLKTGRPIENPEKRTSANEKHKGHLSVRDGRKEPAAGRLLPENQSSSTFRRTISAWITKAWKSSTRQASPTLARSW